MTVPNSNLNVAGTGLLDYVDTDYDTLVAAFGEPNGGPSGDGKTKAEWIVETPAGVATIYDYKNPIDPQDNKEWHIGGFNREVVRHVRECLALFTNED